MKKLLSILMVALFTSSVWAAAVPKKSAPRAKAGTDAIPTAEYLATKYDVVNNIVFCAQFGGNVCSGVVFTGTYNNWSDNPESCVKFAELSGYEGWYVAEIPYEEGAQGKPVALSRYGTFSWEYQAGDASAWIHKGGNSAYLESGYSDEVNVSYFSAGAYIYEIAYWKKYADPCQAVKHNYTLNVYAPSECTGQQPAVWGSFNSWTEELPMSAKKDSQLRTYYTVTLEALEGSEYKFRAAGDESLSWNQIEYYDPEYDEWRTFGNFEFGNETEITYDFSDINLYRFSDCTKEIDPGKPITVAQAIEIANSLPNGGSTDAVYMIEGYVVDAQSFNLTGNNQIWYMADDAGNTAGQYFQAYQCVAREGEETLRKVLNGDKVMLYGQITKYVDSNSRVIPEVNMGVAIFISMVEGDHSIETEVESISVARAMEIGSTLKNGERTESLYDITGYVTSITQDRVDTYGDMTFYIADEANASGTFYVYRGKTEKLMAGDQVRVRTQIYNYNNGTIESVAGAQVTIVKAVSEVVILEDVANYIDFQALSVLDPNMTKSTITSEQSYTLANGTKLNGWYNPKTEKETEVVWNVKESYNTTMPMPQGSRINYLVAGTSLRAGSHATIALGALTVYNEGQLIVYFQPNGDSERGIGMSINGGEMQEFTASGVKIDAIRPVYAATFNLPAGTYSAGDIVLTIITNTCNIYGIRINAQYKEGTEQAEHISVARALEIASQLEPGATTSEQYVISGYVTGMVGSEDGGWAQYKNQIFWIADNSGSTATSNAEGALEVYQGVASEEIKVGDQISVTAQLTNYNGLLETVKRSQVTLNYRPSGKMSYSKVWPILLDEVTYQAWKNKIVYDFRRDEVTRWLYIWENTYGGGQGSGLNFYGNTEGYLSLVAGASGWAGGGFNISGSQNIQAAQDLLQAILANPDKYYLHMAIKSTDQYSHAFYLFDKETTKFVLGDHSVYDGAVLQNFPRTGEWQEIYVPMSRFANALSTVSIADGVNLFIMLSEGVQGAQLDLDAVFICEAGEETPEEETYNINVYLKTPSPDPEAGVEIIGSFSDQWQQGVAMSYYADAGMWAATIQAKLSDEYKFREAGTWDNQIQYYSASYKDWLDLPNQVISNYLQESEGQKYIYLDYSDPNNYRWTKSNNALCYYDIEMSDSYGDGWNGGAIIVTDGSYEMSFTGTGSTSHARIPYYGNTVTMRWQSGSYDDEVGFIVSSNGKVIAYHPMGESLSNGQLLAAVSENICDMINPYKIDSLQAEMNANRGLDISWTAVATAKSYAVSLINSNGVVEDQIVVYTNFCQTKGLSTNGEYTIRVVAMTETGMPLCEGTQTALVELPNLTDVHIRVLVSSDCSMDVSDGLWIVWMANGESKVEKMTPVSGRIYEHRFNPNSLTYGYYVMNKPTEDAEQVQVSYAWTALSVEEHCSQVGGETYDGNRFELWQVRDCNLVDHDYRVSNLQATVSPGLVNFSWEAKDVSEMYILRLFEVYDDGSETEWGGWYVYDTQYTWTVSETYDGRKFRWRVEAVSPWSLDPVYAADTIVAMKSLIEITNTRLISGDNRTIDLTWNSNTEGIQYQVYVYYGSAGYTVKMETVNTTSYSYTTPLPGYYRVYIRAVDANGKYLTPSYYAGDITLDGAPVPVSDLKVTVAGNKITYTWASNVEWVNAEVYRIEGLNEISVYNTDVDNNQLVLIAESDGIYTLRLRPYIRYNTSEDKWNLLPDVYTVSANVFTQTPTYAVSIKASEGGYVLPNEIAGNYPAGTVFELTAEAKEGYRFAGWSDEEKSATRVIVTDTSALTMTANFEPIPKNNYTIRLYQPDACEEFKPAIVGSFTSWADNIPMKETKDITGRTMYEVSIQVQEGEEFKFREVNDLNWSNEILYYDSYYGYWLPFGNNILGADTILTFDYSNNDLFRYQKCTGGVRLYDFAITTRDSITATVTWKSTSKETKYIVETYCQNTYLGSQIADSASFTWTAKVPGIYAWYVNSIDSAAQEITGEWSYAGDIVLNKMPAPVSGLFGAADGHTLHFEWQSTFPKVGVTLYRLDAEGDATYITSQVVEGNSYITNVEQDGVYRLYVNPYDTILQQKLPYEMQTVVQAFTQLTYSVQIQATEGGMLSDEQLSGNYPMDYALYVECYPKEGYRFAGWSDGVMSYERLIVVESDSVITAVFEKLQEYSLTVNAGRGGTIKAYDMNDFGASYSAKFTEGSEVFVAAKANEGYLFAGWSDGISNASRMVMMSKDSALTANFSRLCTLTLNAQNGWVTLSDAEYISRSGNVYTFAQGTAITLTANPNEDYRFVRWNDGEQSITRKITLDENKTFTAVFEKMADGVELYHLVVAASGKGKGDVTTIDNFYPAGTQITLTATPAESSVFNSWSDGVEDNPRRYVVSKNDTLYALFSIKQLTLTIKAVEGGSVNDTVTNGTYDYGTYVSLSATANERYRFAGWSDGDMNAERRIYLTENKELTALFDAIPYHTLTVNAGEGGMILATDTMINYRSTYTGEFGENEVVYLEAKADDGYRFIGWSDGSLMPKRYVKMDKNRELTAEFAQVLKVTLTAGTGGSVVLTGDSFEKTGDVYTVALGAEVQITAVEQEGYRFIKWSDDNEQMQRILTITQDTTIEAQFEPAASTPQYMVTITTDGNGKGSVNVESRKYYEGTKLTLIATPENKSYKFVAWVVDGEPKTDNPIEITVTKEMEIKATFDKRTVLLQIDAAEGGKVNSEVNQRYDYGSFVEIVATPDAHYSFASWSDGIQEATRTIFLTQDTVLTASFEAVLYTVTFKNWDGSVIESKQWKYGETPKCDSVPVRPSDGANEYEFAGWTPSIKPVSSDATYTATYITKDRLFTVTFYDWKWREVDVKTVSPGEAVEVPEAPKREGYVFVEWKIDTGEGTLQNVLSDMDVIATYKKMEEAIDNIDAAEGAHKVLRDGNIYIIRGGKTYSVTGQRANDK